MVSSPYDLCSNPAEVYSFHSVRFLKRKKIIKKRPRMAHFKNNLSFDKLSWAYLSSNQLLSEKRSQSAPHIWTSKISNYAEMSIHVCFLLKLGKSVLCLNLLCYWWESVWPDWAIFCTLGSNSKEVATIVSPKLPTLLGNFFKVATIIHLWNYIWATFIDIWRQVGESPLQDVSFGFLCTYSRSPGFSDFFVMTFW